MEEISLNKLIPDFDLRLETLLSGIDPSLSGDLNFEIEMFFSRLELLSQKSLQSELGTETEISLYRTALYWLLKEDFIFFIQKSLYLKKIPPIQVDPTRFQKELLQYLKEFGIFNHSVAGKDYTKTSILERWLGSLSPKEPLKIEFVMSILDLYRFRIYSLSQETPVEWKSGVRKILFNNKMNLSFAEIYSSEIKLRNEILHTILREIAPVSRIQYLISKNIVIKQSEAFINSLIAVITEEWKKEKEKTASEEMASLNHEMEFAAKMQGRAFQRKLPDGGTDIQFDVWFEPLRAIGGDYYRIEKIAEKEYSIFLGDISGHGIAAGLYINTLFNGYEACKEFRNKPGKFLTKLNQEIEGKIGDFFVTAIKIYINLERKIIRYSNAGHPKGFLITYPRGNEKVRFLRQTGKVLGLFPKLQWREIELQLIQPKRLVLYTDGLSETVDPKGELLTERGLLNFVHKSINEPSNIAIENIKIETDNYMKTAEKEDDISLILVDFLDPNSFY